MLQPLTERQEEIIDYWISENILHGPPVTVLAISELVLADQFDITRQAGIALLSGLVNRGWAISKGPPGLVRWHLSEQAHQAVGLML